MAIIYSYPKQSSLQNTDLLIGTRFSTEPGVVSRSISFSLETLGEYINANHPLTLNQVLTAGNESLLDAKVGSIYLYDTHPSTGYLNIRGYKNRIYFDGQNDVTYGYINQDTLFLQDSSSIYGFNIKKPSSLIANRTATFQDATGTVAYLDDLSSLTLDQVLDNGNTSTNNANIGELGLYDSSNSKYFGLLVDNSIFYIYDVNAADVMLETNGDYITLYGSYSSTINNNSLTANRDYNLPNKSGTIALTSDIPAALLTANYGLFTQTANSTTIVNTNSELSLIGTGLGSLSIPANSFKVGDSFRASLMGHISCLGSATLQIKVKAWNGFSYSILGDTGVIGLDQVTGQHWNLDIGFTIRALGGAEDASIVSGGSFYYNKTNGNIDLRNFVTENNTTFDTDSNNEIVITAQFNNASTSNSIYSNLFTLTKTY